MPNYKSALDELKSYGVLPEDFERRAVTKKSFNTIAKQVFHFSDRELDMREEPIKLIEAVQNLTALLKHDIRVEIARELMPQLLVKISNQLDDEIDALLAAQLLLNAIRTTSMYNPATDWLSKARFGVMQHFLMNTEEEFDTRVDSFNVERFAKSLHDINAGYFVLTVGQNSGYYCTPNHAYDRITGYAPGTKTSRRDLPMDMAEALAKYNIPLILYSSCQGPMHDIRAYRAFGWKKQLESAQEAMQRWGEVVREWSLRYGDAVKGWWIDGFYTPDQYTDFTLPYNVKALRDDFKAGNPNAIFCLNPGIGILSNTYYEDFTAGESNDFTHTPKSRWLNGKQWHELCYIGRSWGGGMDGIGLAEKAQPRFSNSYMVDYIKKINAVGGTLTIDYQADEYLVGDLIDPVFYEQLKQISRGLDGLPYEDCEGQSVFPEEEGDHMPNMFFHYPDAGITVSEGVPNRTDKESQTGSYSLEIKLPEGKDQVQFNKLIDIENKKKYSLKCVMKCDSGTVDANVYLGYWFEGDHDYVKTSRINYQNGDKDFTTTVGQDWVEVERIIDVDDDMVPFCVRFSVDLNYDGSKKTVYVDRWSIKEIG